MAFEAYAPRGRMAIAASLAVLAACGGSRPHPPPPVAPATLSWIDKAEEQQQLRQYSRARLLYIRAKREAPDDNSRGYAAREYGRALVFWGEYEPARRQLEQAVELRAADPIAWHTLGMVAYHLGDADAATAAFTRAIALAPDDPRPRLALHAVYFNQGRIDDAIAELEKVLHLEIPDQLRAKVEQGLALLRKERELRRKKPSAVSGQQSAGDRK